MKAVVMAGGAGSRLRPLTIDRPKPMVPIVNKPVISHILDLLKRHGITDVVITLHFMAETVQDYFGDGSAIGMNIEYSIEEVPLGTAGSVKLAQEYLDDSFLVISGDAITDFDISSIIEYHRERNALATLTLYRVSNPLEYGVVIIDEQGRVQQFLEKPSWGEVISDTVNTGIYVLEPSILDYFDAGISFDFSKDLFPILLEKGDPMYGYVAEGYWCDVGNLSEYMRATRDILEGRVNTGAQGEPRRARVWRGEGVEVASDAQLYGAVLLGDGVQIKQGVIIHGPTVIQEHTVVDRFAHLERSVVWRNCYIGESVELRGAIVGQQCNLKRKAVVFEGAVIGDSSVIGEGAIIHPAVKIWPRKEVEGGSTVNSSIIWGAQGRHVLFGRYGVTGLVNIDLTPELAAKLGAAFGATFPKGSTVTINRDPHRSPRMLKRGIISGLPSSGVNVMDLRSQPIPVARYITRVSDVCGGVHVRLAPNDNRVVDIRFFDHNGQDLSKSAERNIEKVFFREDFRRVFLDEIGSIGYADNVGARYSEAFMRAVDVEAIRAANTYIAVDFANAPTAQVLPQLLRRLNCRVAALNEAVDETKMSLPSVDVGKQLKQLGAITRVLETTIGVRVDVGGERVIIIDGDGIVVPPVKLCAALALQAFRANAGSTIAIPVSLPNTFERIAEQYGGRVLRTRSTVQALMEAASQPGVIMAGSRNGAFIWPQFQPVVDGMMTVAKILEFSATQGDLAEALAAVPPYHMAEAITKCPWESKGLVMRLLNQQYKGSLGRQVDGVKIMLGDDEWVLVLPDADEPLFRIYAQASSDEQAEQLLKRYERIVEGLQH